MGDNQVETRFKWKISHAERNPKNKNGLFSDETVHVYVFVGIGWI